MPTNPAIQSRATKLLTRVTMGDQGDASAFSELLYGELKLLAREMMRSERANHTLQPTALVHEVFLRLINTDEVDVNSKDHFMMLAAQVMRRVLIDHARGVNRQKRGGDRQRVPLSVADPAFEEPMNAEQLITIDEALERLRTLDERKARLVELRFFGGLDEEAAARILGISRSTASSDWRFARAWLLKQMSNHDDGVQS